MSRQWGAGVPTLTILFSQELHAHLSEEIDRLRSFIASQGTGNSCGRSNARSSCELEVDVLLSPPLSCLMPGYPWLWDLCGSSLTGWVSPASITQNSWVFQAKLEF